MEEIVFLDAGTVGDIPELVSLQNLGNVHLYDHSSYSECFQRVAGSIIILTNKVVLDSKIIDAAPFLKLICITATGMNNVDLDYAEKKEIKVKNAKGYSTHSVAQATFGSLLYLINHIKYYDRYVKSGDYSGNPLFTNISNPYWQLEGKTFGIIGLGTIGKQVAKIAEAFGAKVIYYSTTGINNNPQYKKSDLIELLSDSDIVSIHAPLNESTKNLLNYEKIKLMKKSSILINTGRGGIINEVDLAKALEENLIQAASIDVMEHEPIHLNNPLLHISDKDKILITPHIAWASIEARRELMRLTYLNIENFLNNEDKIV